MFRLERRTMGPSGTLRRECLFDADGFAEQIMAVEVVPITGLQTIITLERNSVPSSSMRVSPYAVNHALVDLLGVVHRISTRCFELDSIYTSVRAATLAVGDAAVHVEHHVIIASTVVVVTSVVLCVKV